MLTSRFRRAFTDAPRSKREWFYTIDSNGRLFLEETKHKNFTSNLKDDRFLDFFWRRIRPTPGDRAHASLYPWLSPCMGEQNYIRPYDTPIVFHRIREHADGRAHLFYAGTLSVPLEPKKFSVNLNDGHFYHPAPPIKGDDTIKSGLGLIGSQLGMAMGDHIRMDDSEPSGSDAAFYFEWKGQRYPIRTFEADPVEEERP